MGLNYLPSPAIIQQFFWPIMTLIICVQTYKKFGLVAKIGVGTFVCLIYIQNVKNAAIFSIELPKSTKNNLEAFSKVLLVTVLNICLIVVL